MVLASKRSSGLQRLPQASSCRVHDSNMLIGCAVPVRDPQFKRRRAPWANLVEKAPSAGPRTVDRLSGATTSLGSMAEVSERALGAIRTTLNDLGLSWAETRPGVFSVRLPGTRKLSTECALDVGAHALQVRAFVARRPDENHAVVYRWLLERNLRLFGVAFCVDALGDIYLSGRLSLEAVTAAEVDRLLGAVADAADASFNPILELGFASSIRREWAWRRSRGESTANLAAFAHLDPGPAESGDNG